MSFAMEENTNQKWLNNFVSNSIFAHLFAMILNNMGCFQACKVAKINNDYVWVLDRYISNMDCKNTLQK
jgi:uncharacterized membrane protein